MKVINLINLDTIGGVERLYRQWLLNTTIEGELTLSDRYSIHQYIKKDITSHSKIYYTKKNKFFPIPKFLRGLHARNLLHKELPDGIIIWNKIDRSILNFDNKKTRIIYYDHGASWMANQQGIGSDYWRKIDKIICVSKSAVKVLNFRFPESKEIQTDVIYNPGLMIPAPSSPKVSQDVFNFGIASRIIARKGLPIVLDAIKLLIDDGLNVQLYVAGSGKYQDKLKEYSKRINIDKKVSWMGNVDDMREFYNKIQVLVCPSIYEPFGLTVFEAASCGVPVIATDVDGIHEAVDVIGGRLIKPRIPVDEYARRYEFNSNELLSLSYFHNEDKVMPSLALDPEDLYTEMKRMVTDSMYYQQMQDRITASIPDMPTVSDWAYQLDCSIRPE